MKVVVCKDEDAQALLSKLKAKHYDLSKRFAQQDQVYVVDEVMRGVNYELVVWLQAQGFTL